MKEAYPRPPKGGDLKSPYIQVTCKSSLLGRI